MELETTDDFRYNMSLIAKREWVTDREAGIAAYIIEAYRKEVEHLEYEKKERQASNFIGTVGKRETFELVYLKHWSFDSMYGTVRYYKFHQNGNVVIWKTGKGLGFEVGKTYKMKATVKKHDYYNDIKQTVLTRAKVEGEAELERSLAE
jgi:hypothetical protein